MSDALTPQPLTTGKIIALQPEDLQRRMENLEQCARVLTTPIAPGAEPFLPSVLTALDTITKAVEKQRQAIQTLHEAMLEPGVVRALQRAVREP
jgi:hypothetical protein